MKEMNIVYISPTQLTPYEKNPRSNDSGVEPLIESIKAYGFKVPIIVDSNNQVVCGHTRLKAALKMGLESIPCIIADDLTDEQIKAFRIADNRVQDFSIWDNKLLLDELEQLAESDWFTGFDFGNMPDLELLDEADNSPIEMNEEGVMYECVCRSMDKEKIDQIKAIWESMGGDD